MERYKISAIDAFALLAASCQSVNQKLRAVADHLVATGEIMTPPARRVPGQRHVSQTDAPRRRCRKCGRS